MFGFGKILTELTSEQTLQQMEAVTEAQVQRCLAKQGPFHFQDAYLQDLSLGKTSS